MLLCGKLMGMVGVGISFLVCVLVISRHVVGIWRIAVSIANGNCVSWTT